MCGITGFVDFNERTPEAVLGSMTDVLHHRGPDDTGTFYHRQEAAVIGLGHKRLSILDLSALGHQPMVFKNLVIVFNGEIYNFKEIRKDLEKEGYSFSSNSDTEMILQAYHRWGAGMLERFIGMFAFAVYDRDTQELTLFRDRAGVKPLYYYYKDGLFLFASELKSFHQHPSFNHELNTGALSLFLQYGYIPQPHTIYAHCSKLESGHCLRLSLRDRMLRDHCYWDVLEYYQKPKRSLSLEEALTETETILKSAFEYRMVADVPVGLFLSGGYDSSVTAAILQAGRTGKIKTFTIGFHENEFNEANYAKEVASYLGTDHTEYYCTPKDASDILSHLPEIFDEPFADPSAIPTILVSRLARKSVTVALSADGGDESFGGYNKYVTIDQKRALINKLPKASHGVIQRLLQSPLLHRLVDAAGIYNAEGRLTRLAGAFGQDGCALLSLLSSDFTSHELRKFLSTPFIKLKTNFDLQPKAAWLDAILAIDYKTFLVDDVLTKVDRAAMSISLEGREPLLDHRIIEWAAQLDPSMKIHNGCKKYLLKQIAWKYLPKAMMERPKQGFSIPLFEWCKKDISSFLMEYLQKETLKREGLFNSEAVLTLRDAYLAGKRVNLKKLWNILMFRMWKQRWEPGK